MISEKLSKLVNVYKKYGILGFFKKVAAYISANYLSRFSFDVLVRPAHHRRQIRQMLCDGNYERIIVWRSSFGYNVPLFQRPQHIARSLAKQGCLVLYEVTTMTDDVKTMQKHEDNLYLINFNNALFTKLLMQELDNTDKPKFLQLYSTDWTLSMDHVQSYLDRGFGFIYEYIDHISSELSGTSMLPKAISDKYEYAMTHEDTFVVVTADLLEEDVVAKRGRKNLAFSSNGVDYDFFRHYEDYTFEPEFQAILDAGKPIVCYYGALAKWFDYELVKKIAATDKYSVVLFGVKYDESFDEKLKGTKNVHFMGPRDYSVLKYYAQRCDVLTIPFLINDITRSTSPVKIFEYMAMHKPIVTTDMNECRKYDSVLIGKSHEEFIALLDKALELRDDPDYIAKLDRDARANDWSMKAHSIIEMLDRR